ncbi:MAG: hypothetical protein HWE21_03430 [Cytophagia bacterium]|nr:hypothetical protein [Cytophagia bacterium]
MKKKTQLVIILGLCVSMFFSCSEQGETNPEPVQGFELENQFYATPKMILLPLGESAANLYEFDLVLLSGSITTDEEIEGEEGYFLLLKVFTDSETGIVPGTYVFGQDPNASSIMEGMVVLNFITPATFGNVRPVTSGELTVSEEAGNVVLTYEVTLSDNKKVIGSYITDWNSWVIQTDMN